MSNLRQSPGNDEPAFRGSQLLAKTRAIARTEPAFAGPIHTRLGPDFLRMSEDISSAEWLPLAVDVQLNHAIFDVHGEAGVRRIAGDSIDASLAGTLLGPTAQGALRLFGARPKRVFGLVPRALSLVYRNCGGVSVEASASKNELTLTFSNPPDGFFVSGYPEALAGGFSPVLGLWFGRRGRFRRGTRAKREAYCAGGVLADLAVSWGRFDDVKQAWSTSGGQREAGPLEAQAPLLAIVGKAA